MKTIFTKKVIVGVCFISTLMLSGCATSDMKTLISNGNAVSTSTEKLNPTHPSQVNIYDLRPNHSQVVGRISADNYSMIGMEHSQASIISELKKQASSLGANGIINMNSGLTETTAEAILIRNRQ